MVETTQELAFAVSLRFRVAAAFLADADRSSVVRDADAAPPFLPPFLLDTLVSGLPGRSPICCRRRTPC